VHTQQLLKYAVGIYLLCIQGKEDTVIGCYGRFSLHLASSPHGANQHNHNIAHRFIAATPCF